MDPCEVYRSPTPVCLTPSGPSANPARFTPHVFDLPLNREI